jgi:hypothetical protein
LLVDSAASWLETPRSQSVKLWFETRQLAVRFPYG